MLPLNVPSLARIVSGGKTEVLAYVTFESDVAANARENAVFCVTLPKSVDVDHTGLGEYVIPNGTLTETESGLTTVTEYVPAVFEGICAPICVYPKTVVDVAGVPPTRTMLPPTNPLPFMSKKPPSVETAVSSSTEYVEFAT